MAEYFLDKIFFYLQHMEGHGAIRCVNNMILTFTEEGWMGSYIA
jgi:hypothetical protein